MQRQVCTRCLGTLPEKENNKDSCIIVLIWGEGGQTIDKPTTPSTRNSTHLERLYTYSIQLLYGTMIHCSFSAIRRAPSVLVLRFFLSPPPTRFTVYAYRNKDGALRKVNLKPNGKLNCLCWSMGVAKVKTGSVPLIALKVHFASPMLCTLIARYLLLRKIAFTRVRNQQMMDLTPQVTRWRCRKPFATFATPAGLQ